MIGALTVLVRWYAWLASLMARMRYFHIAAMIRELAGQLIPAIPGDWASYGHLLVHGIGQADAEEEVRPDPIDPGAGEIGVRRANQPVGHDLARCRPV